MGTKKIIDVVVRVAVPGDSNPLRVAIRLAICFATVLFSLHADVRGDEEIARYFSELRRRHLFRVAEAYCLNQLKREVISNELRLELTLELSRTLVDHARNSHRDEQVDLWKRAAITLDDAAAFQFDEHQRLLLELERAQVSARHGEYLAWDVDFSPQDSALRTETRQALDDAVERLKKLDAATEKSPQPGEAQKTADRETAAERGERNSLRTEARLQLAAALLDRVRVSGKESPERATDLAQTEKILKPLITAKLEIRSRARVLLAALYRIRKDFAAAHRQLDAAIAELPPAEISDRIVAEQVRLLLDEKRPADAAEALIVYRKVRGILAGELGLLKVQTTLAMIKLAREKGQDELVAELTSQAEKHVAIAEREAGGYWAHRSRLLLERTQDDGALGDELASLLRAGEGFRADGKIDPAIEAYGKAFAEAERSGNGQVAMEAGFTHASLQLEAGKLAESSNEFQHLAERFPQNPRAPAAHLMWAYTLGRLLDAEKSDDRQKAYATALETHLAKFPSDPTATDAKWMFARFEEGRQNFSHALELYLQIPLVHERAPQAQAAVARCYDAMVENLRNSKKPVEPLLQTAIKQLETYAAAFPPAPQKLNSSQSEVALRLAGIRLNESPPKHEAADRLLERIIDAKDEAGKTGPPADETQESVARTARQLRIISLAGRGLVKDASQLVSSLASTSSTAELLGVLNGLSRLVTVAEPLLRSKLGQIQWETAEALKGRYGEMSAEQQEGYDFCRAQSYVALGDEKRAIAIYEEQVLKSPSDKRRLQRAAQALATYGTMTCFAKSQTFWRRLESLERPGTRAWLGARYNVILCCLKLKQAEEGVSLLRATQLLYPELGGAELKAQFQDLEPQLNALR